MKHFGNKGYRIHSGLQFGCELVLYADIPSRVHSDFCVHIPNENDGRLNWMTIQILVRSMPELHKTLIIANVKQCPPDQPGAIVYVHGTSNDIIVSSGVGEEEDMIGSFSQTKQEKTKVSYYIVEEIAIATEHAPFKHKNVTNKVGGQLKKKQKSK